MNCEVCGTEVELMTVGASPVAGYYSDSASESTDEPVLKMTLLVCPHCRMVKYQWDDRAAPVLDRLYSGHHATYHYTAAMAEYMDWFIGNLSERYQLSADSSILELGCNSGRLLSLFREKLGCSVQGVEPSRTFGAFWNELGIDVLNGYFGQDMLPKLQGRNFDLIFFRHVFEHIPDFMSFIRAVGSLCSDTGAVVIEVPYLQTVIERKRIDNIGYSHLNYYSLRSMAEIARQAGLGIVDFEKVETDGGSIIFHLRKGVETSEELLDDVTPQAVEELVTSIDEIRQRLVASLAGFDPNEVAGYGAGAKGQHLIHMLGLKNKLSYVLDDTKELNGKFIPGTELKVMQPEDLATSPLKAIVNLVPTHQEAIRQKVPENIAFIDPING